MVSWSRNLIVSLGTLAATLYWLPATAQTGADARHLERLIAAYESIRTRYVDPIEQSRMVDAAIDGMISLLDRQSGYVDRQLLRDSLVLTKRAAGLSIDFVVDRRGVRVVTPYDDGPAANAGVRPNDVITHVDGMSVQGLTWPRVHLKLLGRADSEVRLTIVRDRLDSPLDMTIARKMFRLVPPRVQHQSDGIVYVRIPIISDRTARALRDGIAGSSSDVPVKGYVLDLRTTSGALEEAVAIADAFLERGEIVSIRGRDPEQSRYFSALPGDIAGGKPLAVLINEGTALGAEIVAGALQDNKRAIVVGSRSFGHGSVPELHPLGQGGGVLRLTTGRYYTPTGRSFDGVGIVPDIEVAQSLPVSPDDDKALGLASGLLRGSERHPAFPPSGSRG